MRRLKPQRVGTFKKRRNGEEDVIEIRREVSGWGRMPRSRGGVLGSPLRIYVLVISSKSRATICPRGTSPNHYEFLIIHSVGELVKPRFFLAGKESVRLLLNLVCKSSLYLVCRRFTFTLI